MERFKTWSTVFLVNFVIYFLTINWLHKNILTFLSIFYQFVLNWSFQEHVHFYWKLILEKVKKHVILLSQTIFLKTYCNHCENWPGTRNLFDIYLNLLFLHPYVNTAHETVAKCLSNWEQNTWYTFGYEPKLANFMLKEDIYVNRFGMQMSNLQTKA